MNKRTLILIALSLLPLAFVRWIASGGLDPLETEAQGIVRARQTQIIATERRCERIGRRQVDCEDVPVPPYEVEVYDLEVVGSSERLTGRHNSTDPTQFELGETVHLTIHEAGFPLMKRRYVTTIAPWREHERSVLP